MTKIVGQQTLEVCLPPSTYSANQSKFENRDYGWECSKQERQSRL